MSKEIFVAVCDRLKTEVPRLRQIDTEEGQLNTGERPAVVFPCCLIDISYPPCETHMGGRQKIKTQIQLRVALQAGGSTNAAAPELIREHALSCMGTLDKIHEALQWWNGGNLFNPMRRPRGASEKRADGLRVYNMIYETEFMDQFRSKPGDIALSLRVDALERRSSL